MISFYFLEITRKRLFQKMDLLRMDGKAASELVPAIVDEIFFGLGHQFHHRNRAVGATGPLDRIALIFPPNENRFLILIGNFPRYYPQDSDPPRGITDH